MSLPPGTMDPGTDRVCQRCGKWRIASLASCQCREAESNNPTPDLDALLAKVADLDAAATPGPWTADAHVAGYLGGDAPGCAVRFERVGRRGRWSPICMCQPDGSGRYGVGGTLNPVEDAAFIAFARTALPRLAAEVRRLREKANAYDSLDMADREDSARLDWLEEHGLYISLDGRRHNSPIGCTRAALDDAARQAGGPQDSVYVKFDGEHLILTTENGIRTDNTIYLDEPTFAALVKYAAELRSEPNDRGPADD